MLLNHFEEEKKRKRMIKELRLKHLSFGLPLLIIIFLAFLPRLEIFQGNQESLSIGILLDLLITIPFISFFLIRKTKLPKISLVYIFLIGILIAGLIIPKEHQEILSKVKLIAIPVFEIGMISFLISRVFSLKKSFKTKKSNKNDFHNNLLQASNEIFPGRIGKIITTEVSVFYYLFSFKKGSKSNDTNFTYFKKNGIKTIIVIFLFLLLFETLAVHLLLESWNVNIAWALTILSIYTGFQIFSILRSMNKRLISINYEAKQLNLKYGFGLPNSNPI